MTYSKASGEGKGQIFSLVDLQPVLQNAHQFTYFPILIGFIIRPLGIEKRNKWIVRDSQHLKKKDYYLMWSSSVNVQSREIC